MAEVGVLTWILFSRHPLMAVVRLEAISMTRCTTFINSFGQPSLVIRPQCPIEEVPATFRSLVPGPYREFLKSSRSILLSLADGCGNEVISRWLTAVAESPAGLIVHQAKMMGTQQLRVAICGRLPRVVEPIQFALPSKHVVPTRVSAIDSLYAATDGTFDCKDAFDRCGWVSSNERRFDWRNTYSDFPAEYANSLLLYQTNTGDQLFASGGNVFSLMHDSGKVTRQGTAEAIVEDYFLSQLEGRRWYPFPY